MRDEEPELPGDVESEPGLDLPEPSSEGAHSEPDLPEDINSASDADFDLPAEPAMIVDPDELILDVNGEIDADDNIAPGGLVTQPVQIPNLIQHDIAEFYSQPRLVPVAIAAGLYGALSADLVTGWNFEQIQDRERSLCLLTEHEVFFLMLSPPCTAFSPLNELWNFPKMTPDAVQFMRRRGKIHLTHSMDCAKKQYDEGRFFCFEHPSLALGVSEIWVLKI